MHSMGSVHLEVVLAAAYVLFLLLTSAALEGWGRLSQRRSQRAKTVGFELHRHLDAWRCSEGNFLWLQEVDDERRVARYRAGPHICNRCQVKHLCTDSHDGRELLHSLDPWPRSEMGRFQGVVSLTLVLLAAFIIVLEVFRHHEQNELLILTGSFILTVSLGLHRIVKVPWRHARASQKARVSEDTVKSTR